MQIRQYRSRAPSRRTVIRAAAAVGVAAGVGPFVHVSPARAAKALKILQWSHFVPGYDKWFNNTYVKEWGAKNDTEVVVDNIGLKKTALQRAQKTRERRREAERG